MADELDLSDLGIGAHSDEGSNDIQKQEDLNQYVKVDDYKAVQDELSNVKNQFGQFQESLGQALGFIKEPAQKTNEMANLLATDPAAYVEVVQNQAVEAARAAQREEFERKELMDSLYSEFPILEKQERYVAVHVQDIVQELQASGQNASYKDIVKQAIERFSNDMGHTSVQQPVDPNTFLTNGLSFNSSNANSAARMGRNGDVATRIASMTDAEFRAFDKKVEAAVYGQRY